MKMFVGYVHSSNYNMRWASLIFLLKYNIVIKHSFIMLPLFCAQTVASGPVFYPFFPTLARHVVLSSYNESIHIGLITGSSD